MGERGERGRDDDELWFAGMKIRAHFGPDERVEFIEAVSGAPLRLGDFEPFALDRDEIVARVAELLGEPGDVQEHGETVNSEARGLVFWGYTQHTESEREFETISVHEPGYYDR